MYIPGVTALAVTRWVLNESWRSTTLDRLGDRRFYLWAWFLPPALVIATAGLTIFTGGARFDSDFHQLQEAIRASGKPMPAIPIWTVMLLQVAAAISIGPIVNSLLAVGEEVGWRGFLLPRLITSGFGEWTALFLSGAIWGLWHAPLILRGAEYFGHPYLGVPMFIGFSILLGIVFGWMWLASRSVWVTAVAHGSLNAWGGLALVVLTPFDMTKSGVINSLTGCLVLVVFVAWIAWSRRLLVTKALDQILDLVVSVCVILEDGDASLNQIHVCFAHRGRIDEHREETYPELHRRSGLICSVGWICSISSRTYSVRLRWNATASPGAFTYRRGSEIPYS
jgi:membrane protease YdiL (CAAX protease family)